MVCQADSVKVLGTARARVSSIISKWKIILEENSEEKGEYEFIDWGRFLLEHR